MKKWIYLATIGLLTMTLVACGKSDEEKAQDNATNLVALHNSLAENLNAEGVPNASWSDAELNANESKLNTLESYDVQLSAINGSDGISIYGGDDTIFIAAHRQAIDDARDEKRRGISAPYLGVVVSPSGDPYAADPYSAPTY